VRCRKCGNRVPPGDECCVYCGARTGPLPLRIVLGLGGRLPARVKWATAIMFAIGIASAIVVVVPGGFTSSPHSSQNDILPTPRPSPPLLVNEASEVPNPPPTVTSRYISSTAPVIDGILTSGEWGEPAFTKTFEYLVGNVTKTAEMLGYFMNNEESLYVAITASADGFEQDILNKFGEERVLVWAHLYFDNDGNGILKGGVDMKCIRRYPWVESESWRYHYQDFYLTSDGGVAEDDQKNGKGAAIHMADAYTYEFQIPLDSGEFGDLSSKPGDIIGMKAVLHIVLWSGTGYEILGGGEAGWPAASGLFDGSTYSKLVLSGGSAS